MAGDGVLLLGVFGGPRQIPVRAHESHVLSNSADLSELHSRSLVTFDFNGAVFLNRLSVSKGDLEDWLGTCAVTMEQRQEAEPTVPYNYRY